MIGLSVIDHHFSVVYLINNDLRYWVASPTGPLRTNLVPALSESLAVWSREGDLQMAGILYLGLRIGKHKRKSGYFV
jgi:hypothetical protein